jgi:hypothetical protein
LTRTKRFLLVKHILHVGKCSEKDDICK